MTPVIGAAPRVARLYLGTRKHICARGSLSQSGRGQSAADKVKENMKDTVQQDTGTQKLSPSRPATPSAARGRPARITPESAQELLQELLDPKFFGKRGEGWFISQAIVILLVVFPPAGLRSIVDTVGGIGALVGLTFIILGTNALGQYLTPVPTPRDDHALVTDGVYELVRHPMYSGILLAAAGLAVATGDEARLALVGLLFVVLDRKAEYEESLLEERYGLRYEQYKQKVKKFIPWLY